MNKKLTGYTVVSVLAVLLLILPACNMTTADRLFTSMANGAKLPVEYAIASGDVGLMLGCLSGLNAQLNAGNLSDLERGRIALDMIDLLAVLSRAVEALIPYLMEGVSPAVLADIEDFYDTTDVNYLITIGSDRLMEYGIIAYPSPMQLFWSILGLAVYEYSQQGEDWDLVTYANIESRSPIIRNLVVEAELMAAQGNNPDFLPLLDQFRALIGDPNLP